MWKKEKNIFRDHHSQVPVIDIYDNFYRIYYSTRIDGKSLPMFIDVNIDDPSIVINKSTKPILTLGNPGSFDWAGIMPTDIINFENKKYLYYIGWAIRKDVPYHNNLGLAISYDNGDTWEKFSEGPVFHSSYKEPGYIGTVEIMIENGIWRMWYLSCLNWIEHNGVMEPTYDIKYAESINGIDWEPKGIVCIPLEGEEGGISSCRVIKNKDKYIMWYSIRNKIDYRKDIKNSYKIKTAESSDGIVWEKNMEVDLDVSENSVWDNEMVCYPFIVENKNNLIMFYNGNGFGKSGIGYATKEFF
jgi:hypothetical protein